MSPKEKALAALQSANGKGVVLHVATGSALVKDGKARKLDTGGHGRAKAEYVLA